MTDETTPQDDAAMPPASTGSVADIIDRLLTAVKADAPIQRALVVSAAAEIERLRFVIRRLAEQDATLTDAEQEALEWASTLRGLLERLGGAR